MLPASKYPRLIECAVPMTNCDEPEFHYRFGIGLFVDGVKAAADRLSEAEWGLSGAESG
jgi:TetR/AcrR family tetracycline transcriptional repressor